MLTIYSQYGHKKDTMNYYDSNQKVKTFYSHPIIRWMARAIRQKEPMYFGSFCFAVIVNPSDHGGKRLSLCGAVKRL